MKVRNHLIERAAGLLLLAATAITVVHAQDTHYTPVGELIPPPDCLTLKNPYQTALAGGFIACPPLSHEVWLADVSHWRTERRIRIGYDGSRYDNPALQWTQSSFIQPQMMVQDRYFYDPVAGKYTVDRYLDDLEKRYGGIDAVLIWSTYPNMGMDDRNQQDMVRSMPGGVAGVKQMIADFHRRGVRVLKEFLEYATRGTVTPGRATGGEPDSDFERWFLSRLKSAGYEAHPQVGVAKYRIDIGVVHPDRKGSYGRGV